MLGVENTRCGGGCEASPVTLTWKLAYLCIRASSARMICRPDPHDRSTHTVSLKEPVLSAWMMLVPPVSNIGTSVLSRVSPTPPDELKFEPRRVSIPHRGTVDGATCNESTPFPCDGCVLFPLPRVITIPKTPPSNRPIIASTFIQENRRIGTRFGSLGGTSCKSRGVEGFGFTGAG